MTREDLLNLTADGLAALTNRGLVKRATRELDTGTPVSVTLDPDGTLHGTLPDGTSPTLPPAGGVEAGRCSCRATDVCRHLVMLVLAYQRQHSASGPTRAVPEPGSVRWSPGRFSDEDLVALVGTRRIAAARRLYRAGYTALVRRPTPDDPVPAVELGTCTVRFLVPDDLSYAYTDAAKGVRDDVVPLAVWAYRAADAQDPAAAQVHVEVGGGQPATGGSALDAAMNLAVDLLLDGTVHAGPAKAGAIARVRRELDSQALRWPLLALEELSAQLDAHRSRNAAYRPELVAELLAELYARHRAVQADGARLRPRVLGTEEATSTRLRRVSLTGLGCRVSGTPWQRTAEVFLANAGTVLVARRQWDQTDERNQRLTGSAIARHRLGGVQVSTLAGGIVTTESATRSASRVVRLAANRLAPTTVLPSAGSWDHLPGDLVVHDVAAFARSVLDQPPRLVRPRVEAESVRVLRIGEVRTIGYTPGDQRLDAQVTDPAGGVARISLVHDPARPGALDLLAAALGGQHGTVRFVSGALRRTHGEVVLRPYGIAVRHATGGGVLVPDLADGGATSVGYATADQPDPVASALRTALGVLAEAAHHGLRHLPGTVVDRIRSAVDDLRRVGLHRGGEAVAALTTALERGALAAAATAWLDAQVRLLTTAERW